MSRVCLYIATSLDGFIADADGGVGWLDSFDHQDEDYGYHDLISRVGTVVMGGKTYRQVLTFGPWPYVGLTTYVVTRQPLVNPPDPAIHAFAGDVADLVAQIGAESEKDIWLVGGGEIIAPFARQGLIDDYDIAVMPIILGAGIPLFTGDQGRHRLELVDARPYSSGVVRLRYRVPGDDGAGAAAMDPPVAAG